MQGSHTGAPRDSRSLLCPSRAGKMLVFLFQERCISEDAGSKSGELEGTELSRKNLSAARFLVARRPLSLCCA